MAQENLCHGRNDSKGRNVTVNFTAKSLAGLDGGRHSNHTSTRAPQRTLRDSRRHRLECTAAREATEQTHEVVTLESIWGSFMAALDNKNPEFQEETAAPFSESGLPKPTWIELNKMLVKAVRTTLPKPSEPDKFLPQLPVQASPCRNSTTFKSRLSDSHPESTTLASPVSQSDRADVVTTDDEKSVVGATAGSRISKNNSSTSMPVNPAVAAESWKGEEEYLTPLLSARNVKEQRIAFENVLRLLDGNSSPHMRSSNSRKSRWWQLIGLLHS